jgi:electron transport complex protein RnfB
VRTQIAGKAISHHFHSFFMMNFEILISVFCLGGLTLGLATVLIIANRKLRVQEDPRIDGVEDLLPHANCGACGFPGCRPFAEALVRGEITPAECSVSSAEGHQVIADYLGVEVGEAEKKVALLACAGGINVARQRADYNGHQTCRAATLAGGGAKGCTWGCLGLGDCVSVCNFGALHLDDHGLPIVDFEKCTACGDCVDICPKDLFSIHPSSHRLWVACRSLEQGDTVLEHCEVGCDACGRCAMDSDGVITMENNLPVVDYTIGNQSRNAIERCPTGAIVWLDAKEGPVKGDAASKIHRRGVRKAEAT